MSTTVELNPSTLHIQELSSIPIVYLSCSDDVQSIQKSFKDLESVLSSLKGKKFYGIYYPARASQSAEYWACMQHSDGDEVELSENSDIKFSDLKRGEIQKGWYLRTKLLGKAPESYRFIPERMKALCKVAYTEEEKKRFENESERRGHLEFYKSCEEILLMIPISEDRVQELESEGVKKI